MKLYEILSVLSHDTLVAIHNVDKKPRKHGRVMYQRAGNIPLEKIRNILGYDIMSLSVNQRHGGLWIQVFDRDRLYREVNNWDLATKIRERMNR